MWDLASIYVPANRTKLLVIAGLLVTAIAVIDWRIKPYISLGFLYLFPIMIVGGYQSRKQIIAVALVCALLQEVFSDLPGHEALVRLVFSSAGLIGAGLFISELLYNRRIVLKHVEELKDQINLRQDAEEQLGMLVESSPAAIITIDSNGKILLANEAAQQLLAPGAQPIRGQAISSYLPSLQTAVQTRPSRVFRTTLQCRGQRSNGETFLAGIWFSTYTSISGPHLAAIVVDLSEDLRSREDLSLDHLLKNSRILMSAVAHEVRNLCGAVLVVQKNLSRLSELQHNEDFQALSMLIHSLEKISAMELLARNSQRAMQCSETKRLCVSASDEGSTVVIRFADTGVGISSPENLFRPFQRGADSSGLGLYVSRVIIHSFGGELLYERRSRGCCFAVVLPSLFTGKEVINA